jgi:hypothetical protein
MKNEDANRLLMPWLGLWTPTKEETEDALRDRRFDLRRWTLHRTSGAPIERFSSYYWTPLDFFTSEEASALLRRKIRERIPYMVIHREGAEEVVRFVPKFYPIITGKGATELEAIANAGLALIEKEKTHGS